MIKFIITDKEDIMRKILLSLLLILPNVAFCAEENDLNSALKTTSTEPNFLTVIISLLFVLGLIYVTGIIYTKLNILSANTVKKQLKNKNNDKIIVLSTTQLGQNKNLHVVEIGDKRLLLGVTQNSISLIKELNNSEEISSIFAEEKSNEEEIQAKTLEELFNVDNEVEENKVGEQTEEIEELGLYKKYLK